MYQSRFRLRWCGSFLLVGLLALAMSSPADAQDTTVNGTIVSSSRNTVTVSTGRGQFQLFTFANDASRPVSLPYGAQVRVVSSPGNEPGVRVIRQITVLEANPSGAGNAPGQSGAPGESAGEDLTVPDVIRRLEGDIEREARRYQLAFRAGAALDPELVVVGVQGQVGPFFRSGVFFRPALDFGLGEVTALFSVNGDVIYRLPFSSMEDRWSSYFGAGLGLNFAHQSFEDEEDGRRIDFGEFHSDTALNIIGGVRRRGGMFMELKTSIYAAPSPTLRMVVGYTF